MLVFYKRWKKYNETQLPKNKMDLNNRKIKNHPPSPVTYVAKKIIIFQFGSAKLPSKLGLFNLGKKNQFSLQWKMCSCLTVVLDTGVWEQQE